MSSLTEENYLKTIYRLSQAKVDKITVTALAEEMSVKAASAVDMIRKLSDQKLIHYDKKRGVRLADSGNKLALEIVRKHRLWEVFLLEKLNYSWDVVHEIAEQMEHVKHNELADRLDTFLGYPEYDPHGDPIPNANGEIPATTNMLLSEVEVGKACRVSAVRDTSAVFLHYLENLSVSIGTKILVMEKLPFDDSMVVRFDDRDKTMVSKKFTESLLVSIQGN
jgi:DtxR family Mn-dependent transcriptional regulator